MMASSAESSVCMVSISFVRVGDGRIRHEPRINSFNGLERLDLTFSLKIRAVGPVGPVSEWQ
jgi:hypothetical protein